MTEGQADRIQALVFLFGSECFQADQHIRSPGLALDRNLIGKRAGNWFG